jgi:hypothetical protein
LYASSLELARAFERMLCFRVSSLIHELRNDNGVNLQSLGVVPEGDLYRHSQEHRENATFKLRGRPGRDSHHRVVLDPAQGELADASVQSEASKLRLGRVRRKDFHFPAAQVLVLSQIT